MEIDKAIIESDDRRLKRKYTTAIYVIKRALALYRTEEVAFSFNGGKDSIVLLHLLRAAHCLFQEDRSCSNGDWTRFPIKTIYFESSSSFSEINTFTYETASCYGLQLEIIKSDFKIGLENLLKATPIRAIFLGVRIGDPTATGQEQFSPSSSGWPPFMRVNPILDWSYRDIWAFILTGKVQYCCLYDQGYTSIGSVHDTVPNALLSLGDASCSGKQYKPAYLLPDGRLERAGRISRSTLSITKCVPMIANGSCNGNLHSNCSPTASCIMVADEILFGMEEDKLGPLLGRKIHSVGWSVSQMTILPNDIDSVAQEVELRKSSNDVVFIYGGVGPLHSDVSVAGVAKAFGVHLALNEEFEEYLRHSTSNRNEMALLPEGITELLHHEKLPVPLIKCQNVFILASTNLRELETELECLTELTRPSCLQARMEPCMSKILETNLSDLEVSPTLTKLSLDFSDLCIGGYRTSRNGPLFIRFHGKGAERIDSAVEEMCKLCPGAFLEVSGLHQPSMKH